MAIRTVFSMVEDCAEGRPQGWIEFVRDYAPLAERLQAHYYPSLENQFFLFVFEKARANDKSWFRSIRFSNERELMMAFRELVLCCAREKSPGKPPPLSLEQLESWLAPLSVIERQMLWLLIKGYGADQIGPIMANAASTARAVESRAEEELGRIVPNSRLAAIRPGACWIMEEAERKQAESCLGLKVFNNLINGQISWSEREAAEEHIRKCLACTERFTAFQEMIWYRKITSPLEETRADEIARGLGIVRRKGLLQKLLSPAS